MGQITFQDAFADELGLVEVEDPRDLAGVSHYVELDEGLYSIVVGACEAPGDSEAAVALPLTNISPAPADRSVRLLVGPDGPPGWIDGAGGAVFLQAIGRGGVFITTYGVTEQELLPDVRVLRLTGRQAAPEPVQAAEVSRPAPPRELPLELLVHIERKGDERISAGGWAGDVGRRMRLEGFAMIPPAGLAPADIEYMALIPGGRRTRWITDGKLCGTRGRGLPLTGFAIRLVPALAEQFDVVYEGSFFAGGVTAPARNGASCVSSASPNDPLEAIHVRLVSRDR